jgi:hypothetical protein
MIYDYKHLTFAVAVAVVEKTKDRPTKGDPETDCQIAVLDQMRGSMSDPVGYQGIWSTFRSLFNAATSIGDKYLAPSPRIRTTTTARTFVTRIHTSSITRTELNVSLMFYRPRRETNNGGNNNA